MKASGSGLTYQWQVSTNGGSTWGNSTAGGYSTASMWVTVTDSNIGRLYRCKITDSSGNVTYSQPGKIRNDPVAVTTQPIDFCGVSGDRATFTIAAVGSGLTYQWQVSTNGGNTWGNSTAGGYSTNSMWVNVTDSNGGYRYRCKVTDSSGNVVYSEPGEIKLARETWTFTYDADGMRTKRTNGSTTYSYVYNGSQLSQMTVGSNTLSFAYEASGTPLSVTYNGTAYYYATNLQGDITAILNTSGTAVVTYTYDAWGHILSTSGSMASTLGTHNPLRYRGYVYDTETGLYYLQSRYYDPEVGRFINADGLVATGVGLLGNNMFAYCNNNPSNFKDTGGYLPIPSGIVSPQISRYELDQTGNGNITEEKDDNTEKVFKVVKSLWTNFEFSFGIGMGYESEHTILDFLGYTIGMHGNLVHVQLEDGELSCGQEYNSGVAVTALFYNYGFVEYTYNKDFMLRPIKVYKGLYADDTVTIFSRSGYLGIGGNIRVGFDLVNFLSEMDQLFWG